MYISSLMIVTLVASIAMSQRVVFIVKAFNSFAFVSNNNNNDNNNNRKFTILLIFPLRRTPSENENK